MKTFKTTKGTELPVMDMRGKDYLEVKYRLVWFREERPDWSIETKPLHFDASGAVFQATIRDAAGRIISQGTKSETKAGFPDFIEKAETGSIGRALALCGYGTQFCADELDEGDRIVDAPTERARTTVPRPAAIAASSNNLDDYLIPARGGFFKGKTFGQVGKEGVRKAVAEQQAYLQKTGGKLYPDWAACFEAADRYLGETNEAPKF